MLIIISPAKSLDYKTPAHTKRTSQPDFVAESAQLISALKQLSSPEIGKLMHISDKLSDLNAGRYQQWQKIVTEENAKQALLAFTGDVYTGMDAPSFSEEDLDYAQSHLRILSGLYGLLKPLDLMQPYRLEMGTKLTTEKGSNLYQFWGDTITLALNKQLQTTDNNILVNLASQEYFKSVNPKRLNAEIITPVFKDFKNGQYKIISFFAKKARGIMSAWILKNKMTEPQKLTQFTESGYYYNQAESTANKPVFYRNQPD